MYILNENFCTCLLRSCWWYMANKYIANVHIPVIRIPADNFSLISGTAVLIIKNVCAVRETLFLF